MPVGRTDPYFARKMSRGLYDCEERYSHKRAALSVLFFVTWGLALPPKLYDCLPWYRALMRREADGSHQ